MKSIDSVIVMGLLFFVGVLSISTLLGDITDNNINLDEESTSLIQKYDTSYQNVSDTQALSSLNSTGLPNYVEVAAEARESAESKGTIEQFTDLWDILWNFPAVMFASVPFIEDNVAGYLRTIFNLVIGILTIYNIIGLYKAWKTGRTD